MLHLLRAAPKAAHRCGEHFQLSPSPVTAGSTQDAAVNQQQQHISAQNESLRNDSEVGKGTLMLTFSTVQSPHHKWATSLWQQRIIIYYITGAVHLNPLDTEFDCAGFARSLNRWYRLCCIRCKLKKNNTSVSNSVLWLWVWKFSINKYRSWSLKIKWYNAQ